VRHKLWVVIQEGPDQEKEKTPQQVLDALMLSNASLQLKIRSELHPEKEKKA
jgi:hypothetical protein